MFKWCSVLLVAALAGLVGAVEPIDLPPTAQGTFVQRKILSDLDVTLVSSGRFEFEKDCRFSIMTEKPFASSFAATPTNYTFTVNGKTETRALNVDVSSFEKIFEIKEVKTFVKEVKVEPAQTFPSRVQVFFKNGDRLEIELTRTMP